MAKIGNWGTALKFEVTSKKVKTFQSMTRSASYRTATHTIATGKPKLEFLGGNLDTVSFTMKLSALYCKSPIRVEQQLRAAAINGICHPLVIGNYRVLGKGLITAISASYDKIYKKGKIYSMKLDITMMEYR